MNKNKRQIFVVEDEPADVTAIVSALGEQYDLRVFLTGESAIAALAGGTPDLVLLDVMLPRHDGYSICEALKKNASTSEVPIIFLTSLTATVDEEKALLMGAADFIRKPIEPSIVRMRVQNQIRNLFQASHIRKLTDRLLDEKASKTLQDLTVTLLASMDPLTGRHIEKTSEMFSLVMANYAAAYPGRLDPSTIPVMSKASVLHDIGLVGIPQYILSKEGPLAPEEHARMRLHPRLGGDMIKSLEGKVGKSPFLRFAREMALYHHERWDGTGYPHGLNEHDIPLSARIMSVVDAYDALTSARPYRPSLSHETVFRIITEGDGKTCPEHFDPEVLHAFMLSELDLRVLLAKKHEL